MVDRKPVCYCSVCGKLVVINIHGTATAHYAEGADRTKGICTGSEQRGTVYPKEE